MVIFKQMANPERLYQLAKVGPNKSVKLMDLLMTKAEVRRYLPKIVQKEIFLIPYDHIIKRQPG